MVINELHIMGVFFLVDTKKPADPGGRAGVTGGAWGLSWRWLDTLKVSVM